MPSGRDEHGREQEGRPADRPRSHWLRWTLIGVAVVVALALLLIFGVPWLINYFRTVSTDDAFVSSHISLISARVNGQVRAIYVDDNQRVRTGDLLLELDARPYQVAVNQKKAALDVAEANLNVVMAQARAQEAAARANWFSLVGAQEQVRYQIATLRSDAANLRLQEANFELAKKETDLVRRLVGRQAATKEELDQRVADEEVARQRVANAQDTIRKTRAALGLPPNDRDPTKVPANLDQTFSAVQVALSNEVQTLSQIGVSIPLSGLTPDRLLKDVFATGSSGDLNAALDRLIDKAPAVIQARAARDQAREDLRSAELNLDYTSVYAPIDGQVIRRTVNPGNNVTAGQALMAVGSLTDVWIDANFKETEIDNLLIGQHVDVHVDAYPRKTFHGRVEGFSAGTGSSLALIPPENATGNYVKIVQRLPVRITLNPEDLTSDAPLFSGLSAEPTVRITEAPTGPNAGARLLAPLPPAHPGSDAGGSEGARR